MTGLVCCRNSTDHLIMGLVVGRTSQSCYLRQGGYFFHHRLLAGLFDCQQDYVKTTAPMSMKLGDTVGQVPRRNP